MVLRRFCVFLGDFKRLSRLSGEFQGGFMAFLVISGGFRRHFGGLKELHWLSGEFQGAFQCVLGYFRSVSRVFFRGFGRLSGISEPFQGISGELQERYRGALGGFRGSQVRFGVKKQASADNVRTWFFGETNLADTRSAGNQVFEWQSKCLLRL